MELREPQVTATFQQLFLSHFRRLYAYAMAIVKDEMMAEEIVQQVFFRIWEKKGQVDIQKSVTAYLYRAVYNESMNYLKHKKVKNAYADFAARHQPNASENAGTKLQVAELQQQIDTALQRLPEQCRTIFQMSRFEELKYHEIAEKLGISVKTVENQMGKALMLMRKRLADYLLVLLTLVFTNPGNLCRILTTI